MQESPPGNLRKYERKVFSQHGEDGIIEWLLPRSNCKTVVEIGCGTDDECQATNLIRNHGFEGLLFDRKLGKMVTAENVNGCVGESPIGVLSIDVDGNDYWLWKALNTQADIVCIEYNSWLPDPMTIPYDPDFAWKGDGAWFYGASLGALYKLGVKRGYQLVGCEHTGNNAFFIKRELGLGLYDLLPQEAIIYKQKHMVGKVDTGMLVEV